MMKQLSKIITTGSDIEKVLSSLGVLPGDLICLHISLSSLGYVPGGARTIIESIIKVIENGTLMMPSYSGDLSDPSEWKHPSVPQKSFNKIRDAIPAYDPLKTPTRGMGVVAEYFRSFPGVKRSSHPQSSFTAYGSLKKKLLDPHPINNRFGIKSPLGRFKKMNGWVILMGAPFDTVSLFHLTQHLVGNSSNVKKKAPIIKNGIRKWVNYSDIEYPIDWFAKAVEMLLEAGIAKISLIGKSKMIAFKSDEAISEIVRWRKKNNL